MENLALKFPFMPRNYQSATFKVYDNYCILKGRTRNQNRELMLYKGTSSTNLATKAVIHGYFNTVVTLGIGLTREKNKSHSCYSGITLQFKHDFCGERFVSI